MDRSIEIMIKLLVLSLFGCSACALGLADFVPGFITSGPTESADPNLPIKPLVNVKRNSGASGTWYCNRTQNGGSGGGNTVFCKDNASDTVARAITYDNTTGDKSQMVDITNQAAQTTANQTALIDQATKNEIDKSKNNFSLPIQPSKNVNVNVGQSQVDFNIKY